MLKLMTARRHAQMLREARHSGITYGYQLGLAENRASVRGFIVGIAQSGQGKSELEQEIERILEERDF